MQNGPQFLATTSLLGFAVLSYPISSHIGVVLRILSTNWPRVFGVNFGEHSYRLAKPR